MLSAYELKSRTSKFEREAKERAVKEQQRLLREQRRKERLQAKQEEYEEQQRIQRVAERQAQEQKELERDAEIARNRGIQCSAQLQAQLLDEQTVASRGIKRRLDKLVLPASMEMELLRQDAPKNGTMLFEVRSEDGNSTHAGVLEFKAPEGIVLLPRKVVSSLWEQQGAAVGQMVHVSYKYLPKGSFVQFQPLSASFQKEVEDDIPYVLESALASYCTLTKGDIIKVIHNDSLYDLKVLELQPDIAVSVIDTEMEAEIKPSVEYEDKIREQEELKRLKEQELERLKAAEERLRLEQQQAQERSQLLLQQQRDEARQKLVREPDVFEEHVQCVFRLSSGDRMQRRFLKQSDANQLFCFVDSVLTDQIDYRLVTQFPRRVLEKGLVGSLESLGLSDKSYVFFVEIVQQ